MFGTQAKAEEINKLISDNLFAYIRDNKLNVLGEPMPSADQPTFDFENTEDFIVKFDVALAPAINVELSKEDTLPYYTIAITDEMVNNQIEQLQNRFGKFEQVEEAGDKDMLLGDLAELDAEGNIKEGGIVVEHVQLVPTYFKNADEKAKFEGAKKLASIDFNPKAAVEGNEAELAGMLKMKKEEVAGVDANFRFTISEVNHFVPAEKNEELYKNVFGEEVKTEEEFVAKLREAIAEQLVPESDYKFAIDVRTAVEAKAGELEMPVALLKRWLVASGKDRTEAQVEEEMPKMLPDLKWQLIKDALIAKYEVKVEEADVFEIAKRATQAQFAQYGMANVPAELLDNYAKQMMQNKEAVRNLIDRATEEKLVAKLKELVTLDNKEVSAEEFQKMFENN
jgi:trigger factor